MKREYMYNMVFDKVVNEYLNPRVVWEKRELFQCSHTLKPLLIIPAKI